MTDQEGRTVQMRYLPTGRLEQVRFADGTTHTYGYGELGLRAFTQPSDAKLLRSYYDASGNLNLLEHVSSSGDIQSDHYDFDETNRLNRVDYVRSLEAETTSDARELTYDAAGEVVAERIAANDLRFSYDAQDRLVAVADGAKRLVYRYAEDEPDIRLQLDAETRVNLLPWSNSGISIGASNEIIHNRTRLAPYQTIWLDPDLNVFRLASPIALTLPHQAIEDSLMRMRLLELGDATFTDQAHFSRPSNVLFVPGEFRWINCYTPPFPRPRPCLPFIPPVNSFGVIADVPEADLEDNFQCWGGGGGGCAIRNVAVNYLNTVPVEEPFERYRSIICSDGQPVTTSERTSKFADDPCEIPFPTIDDNILAGAHTHPYFETGAEAEGCRGQTNIPNSGVTRINNLNFAFGDGDMKFATSKPKKPLYMRLPDASEIRVLSTDGSVGIVFP